MKTSSLATQNSVAANTVHHEAGQSHEPAAKGDLPEENKLV